MRMALDMSLVRVSGSVAAAEPSVVSNGNTTVTSQGSSFWRVTKTGGTDNTWGDASAVGVSALPGDFLITARAVLAAKSSTIGVDVDPLVDNGIANIDRGFAFSNDGKLYSVENGAFTEREATYSTANYYYLRRVGTTITLLRNASDNIGTATLIHTYGAYAPSTYFDSSIYELNTAFDVRVA